MPRPEAIKHKRRMKEMANSIPKHILKSLNKRLVQLSADEWIEVTVTSEVRVSCMWDDGEEPTLNFCEQNESPEDILENASDKELEKLGLSSIVELRERIGKEITEWINEVKRLEKAYSLEEDILADFFIEGHYEDN